MPPELTLQAVRRAPSNALRSTRIQIITLATDNDPNRFHASLIRIGRSVANRCNLGAGRRQLLREPGCSGWPWRCELHPPNCSCNVDIQSRVRISNIGFGYHALKLEKLALRPGPAVVPERRHDLNPSKNNRGTGNRQRMECLRHLSSPHNDPRTFTRRLYDEKLLQGL